MTCEEVTALNQLTEPLTHKEQLKTCIFKYMFSAVLCESEAQSADSVPGWKAAAAYDGKRPEGLQKFTSSKLKLLFYFFGPSTVISSLELPPEMRRARRAMEGGFLEACDFVIFEPAGLRYKHVHTHKFVCLIYEH